MYEISQKITFMPLYAMMDVPISLKNVKFSLEGNYALPIRITGGDVNIILAPRTTSTCTYPERFCIHSLLKYK